jgi:hypothetical protein
MNIIHYVPSLLGILAVAFISNKAGASEEASYGITSNSAGEVSVAGYFFPNGDVLQVTVCGSAPPNIYSCISANVQLQFTFLGWAFTDTMNLGCGEPGHHWTAGWMSVFDTTTNQWVISTTSGTDVVDFTPNGC